VRAGRGLEDFLLEYYLREVRPVELLLERKQVLLPVRSEVLEV